MYFLGKGLVQIEQIYHATNTSLNTLGLHSVMAQVPKVNIYVIYVLWTMSVPSRMVVNKTDIMWGTKDSLDNVEVKTILVIQPFRRIFPSQIMVANLQRLSAFTKGTQTSD